MDNLFDQWQREMGYETFFRDGVLSPKDWNSSIVKVLFLLKESYDGWDQCTSPIDIRTGTNKRFWWNIARWKFLIHHAFSTGTLPDYPTSEVLPEVVSGDYLLKDIAYVNVKKTLGKSKSNNAEIQRFAVKDRVFLAKQIEAINPDIILCGSTFWSYHPIYNGNNTIEKIDNRLYAHGKRKIIDFYHPGYYAFKGGEIGLYNMLKEVLKVICVQNANKALQAIGAKARLQPER